jgi:hypothetical protein
MTPGGPTSTCDDCSGAIIDDPMLVSGEIIYDFPSEADDDVCSFHFKIHPETLIWETIIEHRRKERKLREERRPEWEKKSHRLVIAIDNTEGMSDVFHIVKEEVKNFA